MHFAVAKTHSVKNRAPIRLFASDSFATHLQFVEKGMVPSLLSHNIAAVKLQKSKKLTLSSLLGNNNLKFTCLDIFI